MRRRAYAATGRPATGQHAPVDRSHRQSYSPSPIAIFTGGEFVLTEQRPRMQSRVEVVPLRQGDAVIFAVHQRPVAGAKRIYRVYLRHGVSRVRSGTRHTAGIIFHDAKFNFRARDRELGRPPPSIATRFEPWFRTSRQRLSAPKLRPVYERAVAILAAVDETVRAVQKTEETPSGTLRITCGVEFGLLAVNEWIGTYLAKYPGVRVEC